MKKNIPKATFQFSSPFDTVRSQLIPSSVAFFKPLQYMTCTETLRVRAYVRTTDLQLLAHDRLNTSNQ